MRLWTTLALALGALGLFACSPPPDNFGHASSQAISRQTLDGTYMKIYGGKSSYFVFHTTAKSGNAFFTEFAGPKGNIIRAEGFFTYGHDGLGNFVELTRTADAADSVDAATDFVDGAVGSAEAPFTAPDASGEAVDAAVDLDAGTTSADDSGADGAPRKSHDPTAAVYDRFHFVKTGAKDTILTRDSRNRTYQFTKIDSYCGSRGAADCAAQANGKTCAARWACTGDNRCVCKTK